MSDFVKSRHTTAACSSSSSYDDDDDDEYVSFLSSGLHPYPGQWVECIQTLHWVQGAPQPPEDSVSTGGHLQLPTQESHREQGELNVIICCLCDRLLVFLCLLQLLLKHMVKAFFTLCLLCFWFWKHLKETQLSKHFRCCVCFNSAHMWKNPKLVRLAVPSFVCQALIVLINARGFSE